MGLSFAVSTNLPEPQRPSPLLICGKESKTLEEAVVAASTNTSVDARPRPEVPGTRRVGSHASLQSQYSGEHSTTFRKPSLAFNWLLQCRRTVLFFNSCVLCCRLKGASEARCRTVCPRPYTCRKKVPLSSHPFVCACSCTRQPNPSSP